MAIILAAAVAIGAAVIITMMVYQGIRYVPYVPTNRKASKQMVEVAELQEGEKVYDLGCGDGRLLVEAMKNSDVKAVGIEVATTIYLWARLKRWASKYKATLLKKNFFDVDLSEADVVFCYLFPKVMRRLEEKFRQELKPGARVISYCFPIESWAPARAVATRADKPKNFLIYRYDIPAAYADQ